MGKKDLQTIPRSARERLDSKLSDFESRFPVSGRIMQALSDEFGGVIGLASHLAQRGFGKEVRLWMTTKKPVALDATSIQGIFSESLLEKLARKLEIPLESVEVQAALGIPKFFSTVSMNRDDFLSLGFSLPKTEKEPMVFPS